MVEGLDAIFEKYERFVRQLDEVFEGVRENYPQLVKCKLECSDCCHALFDLTLIEALYMNKHFIDEVTSGRKEEILKTANKIDRTLYQLKRKAYRAVESGEKTEEQVLLEMAAERVRCPLLNQENRCELYDFRPATCRLYGIPTSISGRGHTCGLSGFAEGESYPTVNLDAVHSKLHDFSQEVVETLRSKHVKMGGVLMPLSMALLTVFDASFLGLKNDTDSSEEKD
jgi:Fe-S-cluster containining protein